MIENTSGGDELTDAYADGLVALDEALAHGSDTPGRSVLPPDGDVGEKLARSRRCLEMLRRLGKSHSSSTYNSRRLKLDESQLDRTLDLPTQFGRFEIIRELGRGGFGVVVLAHDPSLERKVALKVPYAGALIRAELRARFQQEARAAAGLDHPNIVQVYEAGDVGPICYVASAYCPGLDLAQWLSQRRGELPAYDDVARLVATLAEAVSHAHQRGVFHRDIKPANVIMQIDSSFASGSDERPEALPVNRFVPRITDFGLAKSPHDTAMHTLSGAVLGTPCYMAPEQASGKKQQPTASVDIYSLGAVLYQLLTGYVPFQGDSPVETIQQVLTQDPLPPTRLRKSVPRDLETICLKCLQKNPADRYATARELADDLTRFMRREPIQARPISSMERALRFCRRKPLATGLATALVASVLIGLLSVSMLWQQSESRRVETEKALSDVRAAKIAIEDKSQHSQQMLYLHDIALAQSELKANRMHAIQLLENCPERYRGWEWNYLHGLCHQELCTMRGHKVGIRDCAFSPDGSLVATSSALWGDPVVGEVILWNPRTGKLVHRLPGIQGSAMSVAWHPGSDVVAAAEMVWGDASRGGIKLWNARSGESVRQLASGVNMFDVEFSEDGKYLIGAGANGYLYVFDGASFELIRRFQAHSGNVFTISIHPSLPLVFSGGIDGTVNLWNIQNGRSVHLKKGFGDVRHSAFSPDGMYAAFSTFGGGMYILNINKFEIAANYHAHNSRVTSLDWSPDGRSIACATTREGVEIIEAVSGKVLQQFGVDYPFSCAGRFSSDGTRLVTVGADLEVHVWDLTMPPSPRVHELHRQSTCDAVSIPGRNLLAVATTRPFSRRTADDFTLKLFELDTAEKVSLKGHNEWLTSVAASRDGKFLISGSLDDHVCLWSVDDRRLLYTFRGHKHDVTAVAFAGPADRYVVSGDDQGLMQWWDRETNQAVHSIQAHQGPVAQLALSANGQVLASAGADGSIQLRHPIHGTLISTLSAHNSPVRRLAFSPDGQTLVSVGEESSIFLWSLQTLDDTGVLPAAGLPTPRRIETTDSSYEGVTFSADSRRFVTASRSGSVRIWDTQSGHEALRLFVADNRMPRVTFDHTGDRLLLTSGYDLMIFDGRSTTSSIDERYARMEQRRDSWLHSQLKLAQQSDADAHVLAYYAEQLSPTPKNLPIIETLKGDALAYRGKWREADEQLAKAYSLDASQIDIPLNRFLLKQKLKDREGIREIFDAMRFEIDASDDYLTVNSLAWAAVLANDSDIDYEHLLKKLDEAIAVPKSSQEQYALCNTKAGVLIRLERYPEAEAAILRGGRLNGSMGSLDYAMLAIIHHHLGNPAHAKMHLQSARSQQSAARWQRLREAERGGKWWTRVTDDLFIQEACELLGPTQSPRS